MRPRLVPFVPSILILLVFAVVNCYDDLSGPLDPSTPEDPVVNTPVVGGAAVNEGISVFFTSVGEGAAEAVGEAPVGWALGALGLAETSPDYTEQLAKIDEDLQEIISQLDEIDNELIMINAELGRIDCDEQVTPTNTEIGRINSLQGVYSGYVSSAVSGDTVPNTSLSDWADQVLAQGNYSSQTSMREILDDMAAQLIGLISACVANITAPSERSFGDTIYYDQVSQLINYYYYYQTVGLAQVNEALHYGAWVAAGSPDTISADSAALVCQVGGAVLCRQAAEFTNEVYDNLVAQFTTAGAPYTNDDFLMYNSKSSPRLIVRSLEDFTAAAGGDCPDPLISLTPCGVAAGLHNTVLFPSTLSYKGYMPWGSLNLPLVDDLLSGWSGGRLGDYLESTRGFKDMNSKLVITPNTIQVGLDHSGNQQTYVCFFDVDFHHNFQPGLVCDKASFERMIQEVHSDFHLNQCGPYTDSATRHDFSKGPNLPSGRNGFLAEGGYSVQCTTAYHSEWVTRLDWQSAKPGWLAENQEAKAIQYHWPVLKPAGFTNFCTEGRSSKNVGAVWTMCGSDFTAWLEINVPRPPTCDIPNLSCRLSASVASPSPQGPARDGGGG